MSSTQRWREEMSSPPRSEYWQERAHEGWRLAAIEWQREGSGEAPEPHVEEVPYGLRVAADCMHLVEEPTERKALFLMMDLISSDESLSNIATALNEAGFRTRRGLKWSQVAVFNMLPRIVEVAPRICRTGDWSERRLRLLKSVG